jgi:DNA polymerase-3 subunit chi
MARVLFYHMTRKPVQDTAPVLLERALGQGWRVLLRTATPQRAVWLDEALWLHGDGSFLPHGLAGGAHDADQPILISHDPGPLPPGAGVQALMLVEGAPVDPAEVAGLERVFILFEGRDEAAVQMARGQWTALKKAGLHAQYWSEETGRWQMKSETGAPTP